MILYVRADQSCKTVATRLEVKYLQASEHILQAFPLCLTEHRFLWPNSGSLQKKLGRSQGSFKWVFIVRTGLKIGHDPMQHTERGDRKDHWGERPTTSSGRPGDCTWPHTERIGMRRLKAPGSVTTEHFRVNGEPHCVNKSLWNTNTFKRIASKIPSDSLAAHGPT